ncbi:MAG: 2-oxo acid dehydrogenase subunit E2 [Acidimicrobiales bacterium]|nr:2-oxo acid dehydrogenase subunit E2 [Acidimicrobiales bacterium]
MVVVTMPQMGETVTEGTVTSWLKGPGDAVVEDEPLLEISTDKVDADVPAPADGVLDEVLVAEGETVAIGVAIARIRTAGAAPVEAAIADDVGLAVDEVARAPMPALGTPTASAPSSTSSSISSLTSAPARASADGSGPAAFRSPVVRRLAAEHDLDLTGLTGSGAGGRVTRDDVLAAIASADGAGAAAADPDVEHVVFTPLRRTIAERMTASLATAAHTLVVADVDYQAVAGPREAGGFTWLPFIARAVVDALADFPLVNARVAGDGLDVHTSVHLGIAVDLDFQGLVVPVVRGADRLRLPALAEAIAERSAAARVRSIGPDDMAGGTFTLTNAGRYGTLLTGPIINQPQVAILSTDGVKVRPVAVELDGGGHGLAFHPVGNLALSFDHRAMDGAYASAFLARVRELLETRDWWAETGGSP